MTTSDEIAPHRFDGDPMTDDCRICGLDPTRHGGQWVTDSSGMFGRAVWEPDLIGRSESGGT